MKYVEVFGSSRRVNLNIIFSRLGNIVEVILGISDNENPLFHPWFNAASNLSDRIGIINKYIDDFKNAKIVNRYNYIRFITEIELCIMDIDELFKTGLAWDKSKSEFDKDLIFGLIHYSLIENTLVEVEKELKTLHKSFEKFDMFEYKKSKRMMKIKHKIRMSWINFISFIKNEKNKYI